MLIKYSELLWLVFSLECYLLFAYKRVGSMCGVLEHRIIVLFMPQALVV